MNGRPSEKAEALWTKLVNAYESHMKASASFFSEDIDRVTLMRHQLRGKDARVAIVMLPKLSIEERKALLSDLLYLAVNVQGLIGHVREAIWSLPREWLVANIEEAAEPILANAAEWEYRRLLELYERIDRALTLRLARRAEENPDEDVKAAGHEYVQALAE